MLGSVMKKFEVPIHYADRVGRRAYCRRLAATTGAPREVCDFALLGAQMENSPGACRNTALLHTIGNRILYLDEDLTASHAWRASSFNPKESLIFAGEDDPSHAWFYADRASMFRDVERARVDILAAHAEVLGSSLGSLVAGALSGQRAVSLTEACIHILKALNARAGKVVLTVNGAVGRGWTHDVSLAAGGRTHDRFFKSEHEGLDVTTDSSKTIRHVRATTVSHGAPVFSSVLGLDNRDLLPPFIPAGDDELKVFSATLKRCTTNAFHAHLPWAILQDRQRHPPNGSSAPMGVRFCDVVTAIICSCEPSIAGIDQSKRLAWLGSCLSELAELPSPQFSATVQDLVRRQTFARVAQLDRLVHDSTLPEYSRMELRRQVHVMLHGIRNPQYFIPCDLLRGGSQGEPAEYLRRLVYRLGKLLEWWPALITTSRHLANQGVFAAQPVLPTPKTGALVQSCV
jgi:hypothetical protein